MIVRTAATPLMSLSPAPAAAAHVCLLPLHKIATALPLCSSRGGAAASVDKEIHGQPPMTFHPPAAAAFAVPSPPCFQARPGDALPRSVVSSRKAPPLPLMERHGGGTTAARCAAHGSERRAVVVVASSVLPAPRQDGLCTGGSSGERLSRGTVSSCSSSYLSAIDGATQGGELSGAAIICRHLRSQLHPGGFSM